MTNEVWALIPARAGSKRLPNKNSRLFCGSPLIEWTFKAAKNSKYISKTFLSSNSEDIISLAKKNNVEVPFVRSEKLSSDTSTMIDVIEDFWSRCDRNNKIQTLILLQPTSPLRSSEDIDRALEFYFEKKANSVVSVCEAHPSPLWMNKLPADLSMTNFIRPEIQNIRGQDLDKYYQLNGAIYIIDKKAFFQEKKLITSEKSFAFVMPAQHSIDIDTEIEFIMAEAVKRFSSSC